MVFDMLWKAQHFICLEECSNHEKRKNDENARLISGPFRIFLLQGTFMVCGVYTGNNNPN